MSERVVVVNASKMNYDHALDFLYYLVMYRFMIIVQMKAYRTYSKGLALWLQKNYQ